MSSEPGRLRGNRAVTVARQYPDSIILRRLLEEARPYWPHIVGVLVLSLLSAPLALLVPIPLKIAVDSVLGSAPLPSFLEAVVPASLEDSPLDLLLVAAILVVLIALLTQLQSLGTTLLRAYAGEKLVLRFRSRLFRHTQRLSLSYHDVAGTADSVYRIQYDAPSIQLTINSVVPFVTAGVTLLGMIYVTTRIDPLLALVALLISPILFLLTRIFRSRIRRRWRDVKVLEHSAFSAVQEVLAALRVVKAFGQEEREQEQFIARHSEGVGARLRVTMSEASFSLLVGLAIAVGTAVVLYFGIWHVRSGAITLGDLLVVMAYIGQIYGPLKTMGAQMATLQKSMASAERAFALLDLTPEVVERSGARAIDRARGEVEFRDVTFGYRPERPVVRNITFQVPVGSRVGIAGPTGAGKSTLISLINRFYDPISGTILLDGVDLRDFALRGLRDQFAIVLQETLLFSTTVAENIAYARPGASLEEIHAATRAANAHDFILRLPNGYDTIVGERGMLLSGGERQRIALARAFLRDAPILILDEPTSSVDVSTEAVIIQAMHRLMQGRTTFIIAHRLGTLEGCDVLLLLEDGELTQNTTDIQTFLAELRRRGTGTAATGLRPA